MTQIQNFHLQACSRKCAFTVSMRAYVWLAYVCLILLMSYTDMEHDETQMSNSRQQRSKSLHRACLFLCKHAYMSNACVDWTQIQNSHHSPACTNYKCIYAVATISVSMLLHL
jgi:hypothetical protein